MTVSEAAKLPLDSGTTTRSFIWLAAIAVGVIVTNLFAPQILVGLIGPSLGMTAQEAVEAPRFQTEHFFSSFGNHEFVPGRVSLENRISRATVEALGTLGHRVTVSGEWSNSSAPTVIVAHDGVLDGGADIRRARYIFGR